MADVVCNIARGKIAYYSTLPASNDALVLVLLETTGLEVDSTLRDYDTLAALLAGSSNEQTTAGRKEITSVTITVDDTTNRCDIDFADPTWTGLTGNNISALLICYDPDTTGGTDADIIPLVKLDCTIAPDGSDVTLQLAASGFWRSS